MTVPQLTGARAARTLRRVALVLTFALVTAALLSACGGGESGESPGGGSGAATEVKIVMKDNVFEPKTVTVPKGAKVTFEYENQGLAVHNLVINSKDLAGKDYASAALVQAGEKGKFEATFPKAGQVKFICAYHQPEMSGTLTIR